MGGNALKEVTTRRYLKDEYFLLVSEVLNKLRTEFPNNQVFVIRAYRSKDSFGDMDLLFESTGSVDWREVLTRLFDSKQIVKNGTVWSFEYKEFQIDLIMTPTSELYASEVYFSYNDLGNLMGRIAHKMGFKYGHDGLKLIIRDGDYQFAELNVSRDSKKIFEFLGYDFDEYVKGFDTIEDIFKFVVNNQYFNKEIYLLQNRNHTSRVRDRKRKTYNEFLTWLETVELKYAYQWPSYEERGGTKVNLEFLHRAFDMFPEFKILCDETMVAFEKRLKFKALFNGDIVRTLTGLEGPELGKFMKFIKDFVESSWSRPFDDWVIENPALVNRFIMNLFDSYNDGLNSTSYQ